ncbi:hypothetical protein C8J57DRAFT_1713894 [Mycena rebaudengoi]|nr:hypothetical protein C8J57DRAFT_1713894 [Mycena rebaudengoi]
MARGVYKRRRRGVMEREEGGLVRQMGIIQKAKMEGMYEGASTKRQRAIYAKVPPGPRGERWDGWEESFGDDPDSRHRREGGQDADAPVVRQQSSGTHVGAVVDFSDAQRNGFIDAFMDFWLEFSPSGRNERKLKKAAARMLKGCRQHFDNQITRVARISRIVGPERQSMFRKFAKALLNQKNMKDLRTCTTEFIEEFPDAKPWVNWWMRPAHASMLFLVASGMTRKLWDSLPSTTNAVESMHHRIYRMIGRRNTLFYGLEGLVRICETFERSYDAARWGHKIFYGHDPQYWKTTRFRYSWTKQSRHETRRKQSMDGRAPDTIARLKAKLRKKRKGRAAPAPAPPSEFQRSFCWQNNSSWLDSSLTVLFAAASHGRIFPDLQATFAALPSKHLLRGVLSIIGKHISQAALPGFDDGGCKPLTNMCNQFRKKLVKEKFAQSDGSPDAIFGWLQQMIAQLIALLPAPDGASQRCISFFRAYAVQVKKCPKSEASPLEHWEVSHPLWRAPFQLSKEMHRIFGGDLNKWFCWLLDPSEWESATCWQQWDSIPFCNGAAMAKEHILSIPVVLVLEVSDSLGSRWKVPPSLLPLGNNLSTKGVKYTLAVQIYTNYTTKRGKSSHFIARYVTPDSARIFDYDGMEHDGHANCTQSIDLGQNFLSGSTSDADDWARADDAEAKEPLHTDKVTETERFQMELFVIDDSDAEEQPSKHSDQDSLDELILGTVEPTLPNQFNRHRSTGASSNSATPCPINCYGCGEISKGDGGLEQVQCSSCGFWSHFRCQPENGEVDWNDPDITFTCQGCRERPTAELFLAREIVMLPDPQVQDKWRSANVLWYPAQFMKHHPHILNSEFGFRYLECIHWPLRKGDLMGPSRYHSLNRASCEEMLKVELRPEQIGMIRYPANCLPPAKNHPLMEIFDAALAPLAKLLVSFPDEHPVVSSYNLFFADLATAYDDGLVARVEKWIAEPLFRPVDELTALMERPLRQLQDFRFVSVPGPEWRRRALTVGRVMPQLLAIQYDDLEEPLNLNGDMFEDLLEGDVKQINIEAHEALRVMLVATKPKMLTHKRYWDSGWAAFQEFVTKFSNDHSGLDPAYRPKTYRRTRPLEPRRPPIGIAVDSTRSDDSEDDQITPPKTRAREVSESDDEDIPAPKRQATSRRLRPRGNKGPHKEEVVALPVGDAALPRRRSADAAKYPGPSLTYQLPALLALLVPRACTALDIVAAIFALPPHLRCLFGGPARPPPPFPDALAARSAAHATRTPPHQLPAVRCSPRGHLFSSCQRRIAPLVLHPPNPRSILRVPAGSSTPAHHLTDTLSPRAAAFASILGFSSPREVDFIPNAPTVRSTPPSHRANPRRPPRRALLPLTRHPPLLLFDFPPSGSRLPSVATSRRPSPTFFFHFSAGFSRRDALALRSTTHRAALFLFIRFCAFPPSRLDASPARSAVYLHPSFQAPAQRPQSACGALDFLFDFSHPRGRMLFVSAARGALQSCPSLRALAQRPHRAALAFPIRFFAVPTAALPLVESTAVAVTATGGSPIDYYMPPKYAEIRCQPPKFSSQQHETLFMVCGHVRDT